MMNNDQEESPDSLTQIHDKFFRTSLKEKRLAIDFFKAHLPAELLHQVDLSTLTLTDKSFITRDMQQVHSDIIFHCRINNESGYISLLLEHQSTPDRLMPFRFLEYLVCLSRDHLKQGHKTLPVVIPLCLYHGKDSPWPYSRDIHDCYHDAEFTRRWMFKPFQLIDLTVMPEETLEQHGLAAAMELLFKYSHRNDFLKLLRRLTGPDNALQLAGRELGRLYLRQIIMYIFHTGEDRRGDAIGELKTLLTASFPQEKKNIMTFAEQLRQEGLQQGMQQGRQEGHQEGCQEGRQQAKLEIARQLLAGGINRQVVKTSTGLSDEELENLSH